MPQPGLTRQEWEEKLRQVAEHLPQSTTLTLMGSAPGILGGQPSRTSIDLDVWKPASTFDRRHLQDAVEKAGLIFNPKDEIEPGSPYIQIVEAGICQLGNFHPEEIETQGHLRLQKPPVANLIASKLLRAHPKDIEDISWLLSQHPTTKLEIQKVIATFPPSQRQGAQENLVFLDVLLPSPNKKQDVEP